MKHHDQQQLWDKRDYFCYPSIRVIVHLQAGQEPIVRAGRGHRGVLIAGLLLRVCLACFLKEPRTTNPRVVPMGWALLRQSPIKKMYYGLAYSWIWWRHFLCWDFLLWDVASTHKHPSYRNIKRVFLVLPCKHYKFKLRVTNCGYLPDNTLPSFMAHCTPLSEEPWSLI